MLDLRAVRTDPEAARGALSRRDDPEILTLLDDALELDEQRRELIGEVEQLKARRNAVSKEIGQLKKAGGDASELIGSMQSIGSTIKDFDARLAQVNEELTAALLQLPNLPDDRVPRGGEGDAETIAEWGTPAPVTDHAHWDIGGEYGILDLERGAKVAGSGFPLLLGRGAELNRALIRFMIDTHVREHGYVEVAPPLMVNRDSMTATGHLPKFEEDAYRTDPDDLFLVPTAEVPLTNLHRDEILEGDALPLAYVAYTPCFRREAGAAGRDTRGLLRVHQFDKVELVRITRAESSAEELELLTRHAETVLERLELPYRRILLPTGDLGFANAITYDLEVWAAGVGEWLEVSSCSSYTDYQARRAGIRYRPEPGASPRHAHTLNGSALALARLLVALIENGYEPARGIRIPAALEPYLGADMIAAET